MTGRDDRMYVHEASHAICVHVCGGEVAFLTANHHTGGLCRYSGIDNPELAAAVCMAGIVGEEITCPEQGRGNLDCSNDFHRMRAYRPAACDVDPAAWEQAAIEMAGRILLPRKKAIVSLAYAVCIFQRMEGDAVHKALSDVPRFGQLSTDPPLALPSVPTTTAASGADADMAEVLRQLNALNARLSK